MKPSERSKARQFATQAIYQWQMTQETVANIEHQFVTEQDFSDTDAVYFRELVLGVSLNSVELDELMSPFLSRPIDDLDLVEKAILRLSTFELTKRQDVPYKVVINESIELAKDFGAEDSHKFVNGVLDKIVSKLQLRLKK
ncbi:MULTISPECIES: transcription antitermination factor NusB [unclassified Moritella]|jgi:N utilization substance protein B|uniref:transcription antitermination factor NusB n=1 Tax=unclassified Moritella TaxID=2637987 RepID=UPI0018E10D93|nr:MULTISPECIES: transcription antitermination factor NusB [unclassified Moritella]QUM77837.1 transcription antitermination factor NusB [Moritella sp. 24]GIC77305.1 N utilization substance protein B [Moritella sp. F1]GIC83167.1 N utilization substance protein B [Moritella sp. F3]